MIAKVAISEISYQLRMIGWQIWYYQNILFLIVTMVLPFNLFIGLGLVWWGDMLGAIVNLFFNVCMILDLCSIGLVTCGFLFHFYVEKKQDFGNSIYLMAVSSGLLWIIITFLWRLPFFLGSIENAYQSGIGFRALWIRVTSISGIYSPQGFTFVSNPIQLYLFFGGSIFLFLFLRTSDTILSRTLSNPLNQENAHRIVHGTVYGGANLISCFLILFILSNVPQDPQIPSIWITIFPLVSTTKLFLVSFLGIVATRKHLSLPRDLRKTSKNGLVTSNGSPPRIWISEKIQPSPPVFRILVIAFLLFVILPISPAFIGKLTLSPARISGPYITRSAPAHGMPALQYVESLSGEQLGSPIPEDPPWFSDYVMVNESLDFFLSIIDRRTSLEGEGFNPYAYSLNWTISIEEGLYPILNASTLLEYWIMNFIPDQMTRLMWWENNTRIDLTESYVDLGTPNLNETSFWNFTHPIHWVCVGEFRYGEVSGPLAGHFIEVRQLIFLDEDLSLVCAALDQRHDIA